MSLLVAKVSCETIDTMLQLVVPPLTSLDHKGSMGRIGVIGGSQDYCGAPYYSAISALKFGADLAWVYCSKDSAVPIKSYSPELIVTPFYDEDVVLNLDSEMKPEQFSTETAKSIDVVANSPRVNAFLIGPGLGRNPNVVYIIGNIIHGAKLSNMPMVIDADGLWVVQHNFNLIHGYTNCILTPNKVEFERLVEAAILYYSIKMQNDVSDEDHSFYSALLSELCLVESTKPSPDGAPSSIAARRLFALSAALGGVTVLRKGQYDMVASTTGASLRGGGGVRQGLAAVSMDDIATVGSGATSAASNSIGGSHSSSFRIGDTSSADGLVFVVEAKGSPRRCGGLGDVLSGVTAVALHWALQRKDLLANMRSMTQLRGVAATAVKLDGQNSLGAFAAAKAVAQESEESVTARNACVHACILASIVAKQASELAFAIKGRSITAPDVINQIGAAFQKVYPEE